MGQTGSFNPMFAAMGTSAIGSVGTAISQSRALSAQGDVQAAVANTNAKIANLQASQTLEAGDIAASRRDMATRAAIGTARAAAGASGTDVNTGSNALARIGMSGVGTIDELQIRTNAARQAWGYQTQAIQDTYGGKFAQLTAQAASDQALLTGGLQALSTPLSIYANYSRWTRYLGGGGGSTNKPFDVKT